MGFVKFISGYQSRVRVKIYPGNGNVSTDCSVTRVEHYTRVVNDKTTAPQDIKHQDVLPGDDSFQMESVKTAFK